MELNFIVLVFVHVGLPIIIICHFANIKYSIKVEISQDFTISGMIRIHNERESFPT